MSLNNGGYTPGLQRQQEAVISAHFMHAENMNNDLSLYSEDAFKQKSITVTKEDFLKDIVAKVKTSAQEVIDSRSIQIAQNTRRRHSEYGISDANKVGAAEIITEALLDAWFRKGPLDNSNKLHIRNQVAKSLESGENIKLVVPLLPNKVDTPLKTRGAITCMAEIGLLNRLAEITGVIDKIIADYQPNSDAKSEFLILADGHRFQSALNVGEDKVQEYQNSIKWWIDTLGYSDKIKLTDYEHEVSSHLSSDASMLRKEFMRNAHNLYNERMLPILDTCDVEGSLLRAIECDPIPDEDNQEGRFVPLFKSILYTYEDDLLPKFCERWGLSYQDMYKDITANVYNSFYDLSDSKAKDMKETFLEARPINMDAVKEFFRRDLIENTWNATIKYLTSVKGDRDLFEDPVSQIFPDHIRYTIHSKKGQIGLCTTGSRGGDLVQAWHGVSILRASKKQTSKFDNTSRLSAEGNGAVPVLIEPNGKDDGTPLDRLAQKGQPVFYVDSSLDVQNSEQICDIVQNSLTRRVFR